MSTIQYEINRVKALAGLDNFNTPISQIESALNLLSGRLSGMANKQALIQYLQPLYKLNDVVTALIGDLVYWDTLTGSFKPAIALLNAVPSLQGQSILALSARVCGMLLSITNGTGTLLTGGFYTSEAAIQGCLGSLALPGTYYLSALTAGKATQDTSINFRQPVLLYFGNGKFCIPLYYLAHDSHQHGTVLLQGTWLQQALGSAYPYKYIPTQLLASLIALLGELTTLTTAIYYKGILQTLSMGTFVIVNSLLYATAAVTLLPSAGDILVANHYPLAYGSPIVRSILSSSLLLKVNEKGHGNILLQLSLYSEAQSQAADGTAIQDITNGVITRTPVITQIQAGPGISIMRTVTGSAIISSSYLALTPLLATLVNFNGAVQTSSGNFIYTTFVAGKLTSVIYYMPVSAVLPGTTMSANVWVQSATAGNINVELSFVPLNTETQLLLPTTMPVTGSMYLGAVDSGYVLYTLSGTHIDITGPGLLVCKLIHAAGNLPLQLIRYGFILHPVAKLAKITSSSVSTVDAMVYSLAVAGLDIPAFTAVYINNGSAYICKASEELTYDLAVGVTPQAYSTGDQLSYVAAGIVQNSLLDFSAGQPLYIGPSGLLIQPTLAGLDQTSLSYVQRIGIALSSDTMQIRIGTAVSLTDVEELI